MVTSCNPDGTAVAGGAVAGGAVVVAAENVVMLLAVAVLPTRRGVRRSRALGRWSCTPLLIRRGVVPGPQRGEGRSGGSRACRRGP